MDKKTLRLLLVDPSADDAEAALAALRASGLRCKPQRVPDRTGVRAALAAGGWDAVITEHAPPGLDAGLVLDALRDARLDVPLLVLARAATDADLTALMRAGVRDVILKNRLARLPPALERELAAAAERAAHRAALQALHEMEQKHRAVVQSAREAVGYSQDGMHIDANPAYLQLFGFDSVSELEGVPVLNLIDKGDHARFRRHMRAADDGGGTPQEFAAVRRNGERIHIEAAVSRVTIDGEPCAQLLVSDVSQRRAIEAKLHYLDQHDPLTGLYNRDHFLTLLDRAVAEAANRGAAGGIVYLDLHGLRATARTLGHAEADRLLLAVAGGLRQVLGPQAHLARCGEHEFAALIDESQPRELGNLAAGVRRALAAGLLGPGEAPPDFGCHLAFAVIDAQARSAQTVMAALYAARERPAPAQSRPSGFPPATPPPAPPSRNALRAQKKPARPTPAEVDWSSRVAHALGHDGLRLIYQPIVNLHADAAEYFEVLVRMVGEDGALIPARQFIAPAEKSGQAAAIDRWVVEHSIRTLAELRRQGRKVTFFVNLSDQGLREPELLLAVRQALSDSRLNGRHVVLEIDETALTASPEQSAAFLRAAERIGCRVCLDNFGRNMPTADALRQAPIEYVKLDSGLAANLSGDPVAQASLRAVVEVARAIGRKTIAKGIESAESLSVLWEVGIDYVQGYYFREGDADPTYDFEDETTLSAEYVPPWAVADPGENR